MGLRTNMEGTPIPLYTYPVRVCMPCWYWYCVWVLRTSIRSIEVLSYLLRIGNWKGPSTLNLWLRVDYVTDNQTQRANLEPVQVEDTTILIPVLVLGLTYSGSTRWGPP